MSLSVRTLSIAGLVAGAMIVPGVSGSPASAKEIILNNYLPPRTNVYVAMIDQLQKRIEKESKGAITVKIPATSLGPQWKQWELAESGVADITMVPNYSQRQRLILPTISELPLLTKSVEAANVALWKTQQKYFDPVGEYKGVKLLSFILLKGRDLANSKHAIAKAEDVQGLKIWTQAGVLLTAVKTLGGVGVTAPYPQLFELASKGNIDGMTITSDTLLASKTTPYVKFLTEIPGGLGNVSFSVIMNQATWNGFSADEKAAVMRATDGLPAVSGKIMDEDIAKADAAVEKMGVKISQASPAFVADLEKKLAFIRGEWIDEAKKRGLANPKEALDYYVAEMNRLSN